MYCAEGTRNHGLLNITVEDFFKIKILMSVSREEQQKIANCLSAYDEVIQIKKDKLEVWKEIKKDYYSRCLYNVLKEKGILDENFVFAFE